MNNKDQLEVAAYLVKEAFMGKAASRFNLAKRIMSLGDKSLERLKPGLASVRRSGQTPSFLTGEGGSAFGVTAPRGAAGVQPNLTQYLVNLVRAARNPSYENVLGSWREVKGQGDILAKKAPGSVLGRFNKSKEEQYW